MHIPAGMLAAIKGWSVAQFKTRTPADPKLLANFLVAFLRSECSGQSHACDPQNLRNKAEEQLEEFLGQQTRPFVDKLLTKFSTLIFGRKLGTQGCSQRPESTNVSRTRCPNWKDGRGEIANRPTQSGKGSPPSNCRILAQPQEEFHQAGETAMPGHIPYSTSPSSDSAPTIRPGRSGKLSERLCGGLTREPAMNAARDSEAHTSLEISVAPMSMETMAQHIRCVSFHVHGFCAFDSQCMFQHDRAGPVDEIRKYEVLGPQAAMKEPHDSVASAGSADGPRMNGAVPETEFQLIDQLRDHLQNLETQARALGINVDAILSSVKDAQIVGSEQTG